MRSFKRRLHRIEGPPKRKPSIWLFMDGSTGRTYRDGEWTEFISEAGIEELQKTHKLHIWEFVPSPHKEAPEPELSTNGVT